MSERRTFLIGQTAQERWEEVRRIPRLLPGYMEDNTPAPARGASKFGLARLHFALSGEPNAIDIIFDAIYNKQIVDGASLSSDPNQPGPWHRVRHFDPKDFATAVKDDFFADVRMLREIVVESTVGGMYRWHATPGNELIRPRAVEFEIWRGVGTFEVRIY